MEKENKVRVSWIKNGSDYQRVEGECDNVETIPPGIYTVHVSDKRGWWLEFYREKFTFDYKVYGVEDGFIDYFMKTYENTHGNIGVMFNGVKGTGKTVTAKVLANKLNIPVIIVKGMGDLNPALMEYLSSFNFDCVYFFDEFEKNFKDDDASVLQIMDGVYNSEYRKIFLLTTNRTWVNENLLSRPSRIRYIKEFKNISKNLIEEYMEDNLIDKSAKNIVFDYIDTLEVSTIDILKTTVQEINIHGKDSFKKNMVNINADPKSIHYVCYFLPVSADRKLSIRNFLDVCRYFDNDHNLTGGRTAELKPEPDYGFDGDCEAMDTEATTTRYAKKTVNNNFYCKISVPGTNPRANTELHPADPFSDILPSSGFTGIKVGGGNLRMDEIRELSGNIRSHWNVHIAIPFKRLEVGDEWYDGEEIIAIDHENNVIVTDNDGYINYYKVLNPDEKKSNYANDSYSKYSFLY